MDKPSLMNRLKEISDIDQIIIEINNDSSVLDDLFEFVQTENTSIKYLSSKIIRKVSERNPERIYPHASKVIQWLNHKNSFIKWDGILTLSNLLAIDHNDKLNNVLNDYLEMIHSPQMITAGNVIGNAWKIVVAKPKQDYHITSKLIEVPFNIYYHKGEPSPECNNILCGKVIECFEHYFEYSNCHALMIKFAQDQLSNSRKLVVKRAECFLKNHG